MRIKFLFILCAFSILYSLVITLLFINQVPLEHHAFRQTQTALTAYWIKINSFSLNYETPVFGFPWAIPMEFPIYQLLVAYISKALDIPLDPLGRGLSYIFLLASLYPIYRITIYLQLSRKVILFFVPIFLTQPIYLFWGRAFMIETTALFFSLMAVSLFLDCINSKYSPIKFIALFIFASLGLLQKITTALPILLVVCLALLYSEYIKTKSLSIFIKDYKFLLLGISLFLAVLTAYSWINYSDGVKWERGWNGVLTSHSLNSWNWGTLDQRFSYALWVKVIGGRIFLRNLGSVIGLGLIIYLFISNAESNIKKIAFLMLALAFAPLLIFTNLHIVHDYYQVANIIFLTYLLALSLNYAVLAKYGSKYAYLILIILLVFNFFSGIKYVNLMRLTFDINHRDIAVSYVLNNELTRTQQFVAFGNDWSSTFSYLSERKSFTVPTWFENYQAVIDYPENYVEPNNLGGILSCGREGPSLNKMFTYKLQDKETKIAEVSGCYLLTNSTSPTPKDAIISKCNAEIDDLRVINSDDQVFLGFSGWINQGKGDNGQTIDTVYLQVINPIGQKNYFELTKVPMQKTNLSQIQNVNLYFGFSRIFSIDQFNSNFYSADLVYKKNNQYFTCGISKFLKIK